MENLFFLGVPILKHIIVMFDYLKMSIVLKNWALNCISIPSTYGISTDCTAISEGQNQFNIKSNLSL